MTPFTGFYTKPLTKDTEPDWDLVANASDEAWIFHNIKLSDALALRKNAVKKSIIIYDKNNRPIAICPLYYYNNDWRRYLLRNERVLESFYLSGPALINEIGEENRSEVLKFMGEEIKNLANSLKADKCTVEASFLCRRHNETHYAYISPLLDMGRSWTSILSPTINFNLSGSEEDLLLKMEKEKRRVLRSVEKKNDITIRQITESDYPAIWDLYIDMHTHSHIPMYNKKDLDFFLTYEHSNFFIAEIEGKIASAINIIDYNNTGYAMSFYTSHLFRNTDIATHTLWNACKEMKKRGILNIDLGDQPYTVPGSRFDTIASFKIDFGCEVRYKFRMQYTRP